MATKKVKTGLGKLPRISGVNPGKARKIINVCNSYGISIRELNPRILRQPLRSIEAHASEVRSSKRRVGQWVLERYYAHGFPSYKIMIIEKNICKPFGLKLGNLPDWVLRKRNLKAIEAEARKIAASKK